MERNARLYQSRIGRDSAKYCANRDSHWSVLAQRRYAVSHQGDAKLFSPLPEEETRSTLAQSGQFLDRLAHSAGSDSSGLLRRLLRRLAALTARAVGTSHK